MQIMASSSRYRVGLISDTHGLLRPEACAWLRGSDFIIHAGDIGRPEIIETLAELSPTTAVRGNNDKDDWALALPDTAVLNAGEVAILVIHDLQTLDRGAAGFDVVVTGHSHRPYHEVKDGVLIINPGSAGPRRFRLPISAGELLIAGKRITPRLVELPVKRAP